MDGGTRREASISTACRTGRFVGWWRQTDRLSVWPTLKRTVFDAFTRIVPPVYGLRAWRAGSFATTKEPKPVKRTFLFFFSELVIVPSTPSMASLATTAVQPVVSRITEIKWFLSLVPAGVAL